VVPKSTLHDAEHEAGDVARAIMNMRLCGTIDEADFEDLVDCIGCCGFET
jgi:hypothetical protein